MHNLHVHFISINFIIILHKNSQCYRLQNERTYIYTFACIYVPVVIRSFDLIILMVEKIVTGAAQIIHINPITRQFCSVAFYCFIISFFQKMSAQFCLMLAHTSSYSSSYNCYNHIKNLYFLTGGLF